MEQIITMDVVKQSAVGKIIGDQRLYEELKGVAHSSFAAFLLYENQNRKSEYRKYLNDLPKDFSHFPLFFSEDEKKFLRGSPILEKMEA